MVLESLAANVLPQDHCIRASLGREGLTVACPSALTPEFAVLVRSRPHVLYVALLPMIAACASLTSRTTIEPGKAFRLGGGQAGAFVGRGTNAGPVPIVVFSERDGKRDSVLTLAPGAHVDARFSKSAMAIFKNTSSTQTATVAIEVTGDIGALGMGYERNSTR